MKVLSLFCGCGGFDTAFKMAGFQTVWAVDCNKDAVKTFLYNVSSCAICEDIKKVDFSDIPDADVVIGGFPCQTFSIIGKRKGIKDQRGLMFLEFARCLKEKQPRFFVAENVKGLLNIEKGRIFKEIITCFNNCNYNVFFKLVNFAFYGVPQYRERVIIVGVRKDLKKFFEFPKYTHCNYRSLFDDTIDLVTVKKALADIAQNAPNHEIVYPNKKTQQMFLKIKEGEAVGNSCFSNLYRKIDSSKPSITITAASGGGHVPYHFQENRFLTCRELARLQSFTDDFVFFGNKDSVRRQIGNAVPPVGMLPIAKSVANLLKCMEEEL